MDCSDLKANELWFGSEEWLHAYAIELESITAETAALQAEAQALLEVAASGQDYGYAMEFAQAKADLLLAAQRSGLALTPELEAQITNLAAAQTRAGVAASDAADKIREIQDAGRKGAQAVSDIFAQMASGALTAEQALGRLLLEMAKVALQKRLMAMAEDGGVVGNVLGFIGNQPTQDTYIDDARYELLLQAIMHPTPSLGPTRPTDRNAWRDRRRVASPMPD